LLYYLNGTRKEDVETLRGLADCSDEVPALAVAARHLVRWEIRRTRRSLPRKKAPRVPPWAARGCCQATNPMRRLDGPAGAAWKDPLDGKLDDWIAYVDDDCAPPRDAEFSPLRNATRWATPPKKPPDDLDRLRKIFGAALPSRLSLPVRGGAALDSYGYAWSQTHETATLSVPLPPGTVKSDVICTVTFRTLLVGLRVHSLKATPFSRGALRYFSTLLVLLEAPDDVVARTRKHPSYTSTHLEALLEQPTSTMQTIVGGQLFAPVDASAHAWYLEDCKWPRPGPLGPVLSPVLSVSLPKASPGWWQSLVQRHPTVRPRDIDFMVNHEPHQDDD